jgi:hypothetical protein
MIMRAEAGALDRHFAAWQSCRGCDAFDPRCTVRFQVSWSRCCHVTFRSNRKICRPALHIARCKKAAPTKSRAAAASKPGSARKPQSDRGINAGDPVIRHDTPATGKRLGLSRWKRLPDIENAKKYKTEEQIFPVEGRAHDYETRRHGGISKFRNLPPDWNPTPNQDC